MPTINMYEMEPSVIDEAYFDTPNCMMVSGYLFLRDCALDERTTDTFHPIHG
jgi:hypothetical protein